MPTLLIAEHNNQTLGHAVPNLVSAAVALGEPVTALVAGQDCMGVAKECAALEGVDKVLIANAPHLEHQLAEAMAELVLSLAGGYDAIVALASSAGKNMLPRVAARLDVMQLSDVVEIKSADTFVRPTYAGNAYQTVKSSDAVKLITFRGSAFSAAETGGVEADVEEFDVPADPGLTSFVSEELSQSARPDLGAARVVVSGGRAFGSRDNFDKYLDPLAAKLGAAIGASRAAVDSGYAPNDLQVGQTGKVVAPDLYIACGISGAIQHLAGMKESRCIVAINKDAEAPIFKIADYGLVGDIFEILPELSEKL